MSDPAGPTAPLPPTPPAPPQRSRRGLIAIIAVLAALLIATASVLVTVLLMGGAQVAGAAATSVSTPTPTPSAPSSPPASATPTPAHTSSTSGSSGGGGTGTTTTAPSTGSISHAAVGVESGGGDCSSTPNLPLTAAWKATGTTLWFGVNTTDASAAPFQEWSLATQTQGTATGFVYDCSRSSEPFTFTLLHTDGTKTNSTVTLRLCPGSVMPKQTCS
ncbi:MULTISPECIES: hypothetical protein [Microbacterium]|uniref:hypothetical protein n=1 Tax=Microbacterium TaxID=33882 RepID=UPI0010F6AC62|nr:hypothetical protein [Microbacterium sp. 4NA327F11]MCK9917015.1 hypothetical protein [Microbacteriaceae bacterium K1510]